jgi:TfoX/Sxy family transcriptional regulator of competence genes
MQYVVDQLARLSGITARKMFGEYSIYLDGKVIGFVADDQFFVKQTPPGKALLGEPTYGAPYPGAKACFLITDDLDNSELLCKLVQVTANALPMPKPKPARKLITKVAKPVRGTPAPEAGAGKKHKPDS